MGQEIVYCWKCNNRILGSDFEKGKAVQVGNRASCGACATPQERQAAQPKSGVRPPLPSATPRAIPRGSTSVSMRAASVKPGPNLVLAGAGGAAVALVLVLIVVASSGGSKPPVANPAVKSTKPAEIPPKEKAAREAAAKAKTVTDLEARIKAWQDVVFASEGTSVLPEATRELKAALALRTEAMEVDFRRLDEASRAPLREEEFGKALELLDAGRKRYDDQDWRLKIDKRLAQIRRSAEDLLPPLLERAGAAKRTDAKAELKAVEDRVAKWGVPALADALRAALAVVPTGGVHQQGADGLLVIEAESYATTTAVDGQSWTAVTEPPGFTGAAAMRTQELGKNVGKDHAKRSPRLEYRVNFVKTGRHYFWWRGYGLDTGSNSIHAGLDGVETPTLKDLGIKEGAWIWSNRQGINAEGAQACFDIDKPGPRTLLIYMREDGAHVDRVAITHDPKWIPKGNGPPESSR